MNLTVIGTGYVGLVTGACFAEKGNIVTCVDIDEQKIAALKKGVVPIYEAGLDEMVARNLSAGRLRFTTKLADPIADAVCYFIAVGTPPGEDGSADLRHVLKVARDIGRRIKDYCVVVDKSTVPVGTAEKVREAVAGELRNRGEAIAFDVVSNPEFLREGVAVDDFMHPSRIIVGADSERAAEVMRELYAPFEGEHSPLIFMGTREAEMSKYAANAMLATKISFMNEIAGLCERLGVDVEAVRVGIGSDPRIGYSFIRPGAGYGGSCLPKDVKALVRMADECGFEPKVLRAVDERNEQQKRHLLRKVAERFGEDLGGRTFAVWGLAFKPGTDDMREAPSLAIVGGLVSAGARVQAYDPAAMAAASRLMPPDWLDDGRVRMCHDQYEALRGADAMILVTEWEAFRKADFDRVRHVMKTPVIFDGRNMYDPAQVREAGLEYFGIGR